MKVIVSAGVAPTPPKITAPTSNMMLVDASQVVEPLALLTILAGAGNDALSGTPFTDTLDDGLSASLSVASPLTGSGGALDAECLGVVSGRTQDGTDYIVAGTPAKLFLTTGLAFVDAYKYCKPRIHPSIPCDVVLDKRRKQPIYLY